MRVRGMKDPPWSVWAAAVILAGVTAATANAQAGGNALPPGLDGVAQVYRTAAAGWQSQLIPIAQRTFVVLATLEFCVSGLVWAIKRESLDELAAKFLLKFTLMAFLLTLITSFNFWLPPIFDSFVAAGEQVTGGGTLSPNAVIDMGAQIAWQLAKNLFASAFASSLMFAFVCAFCVLAVFVSYLAVAIQLVLVMAYSYVTILGGGVFFLGFAASRWTAAYAEHLVAHAFYLGARAFLLYLVVAVGVDVTAQIQPYLDAPVGVLGSLGVMFRIVGAAVTFGAIAWQLPKDVADRLMQHTSLGLARTMRELA
jgi:type IV secretion system protein TrbL